MNKLLLLILTILFFTLSLFSQEDKVPVKVLFLGNSYTYYNDGVDQVFKQIASSLGDEVETL